MEEKERFYFTEIEKTFLQNAAPEYVYEWIKKHFGNQGDSFFKKDLDDTTLEVLSDRKNTIIDLALAQYSSNEDLLGKLYKNESRAVRIAVLANRNRRPIFGLIMKNPCLGEDQIKQLCENGADDELEAYFSNPCLRDHHLADAFRRENIYAEIPESQWMLIVMFSMGNPYISKPPKDEFPVDGFEAYSDGLPLNAFWEMMRTISNTMENSKYIAHQIEGVHALNFPVELILNKEKNLPPKKDRELMFLNDLLGRWTARGKEIWLASIPAREELAYPPPSGVESFNRKLIHDLAIKLGTITLIVIQFLTISPLKRLSMNSGCIWMDIGTKRVLENLRWPLLKH